MPSTPDYTASRFSKLPFKKKVAFVIGMILSMFLLIGLLSAILLMTGGAAALPIIGTWFVGMAPVLASVLASSFIVVSLTAFTLAAYGISRIITKLMPPKRILTPEDMTIIIDSLLFKKDQNEAAIKLLAQQLENHLEVFVNTAIKRLTTHEGFCRALHIRGTVVTAVGALPIPDSITPEELKAIWSELNNAYLTSASSEHLTIQPPAENKTYKLLDSGRLPALPTRSPLSTHLEYDTLQFMIKTLVLDIVTYKANPRGKSFERTFKKSEALQTAAVEIIKTWANMKVTLGPNLIASVKPLAPTETSNFSGPYERRQPTETTPPSCSLDPEGNEGPPFN